MWCPSSVTIYIVFCVVFFVFTDFRWKSVSHVWWDSLSRVLGVFLLVIHLSGGSSDSFKRRFFPGFVCASRRCG